MSQSKPTIPASVPIPESLFRAIYRTVAELPGHTSHSIMSHMDAAMIAAIESENNGHAAEASKAPAAGRLEEIGLGERAAG